MQKNNFSVNTEIYPPEYILQAIADFEGYSILFDPSTSEIIIDDENAPFIFDELMNYVLSLILE